MQECLRLVSLSCAWLTIKTLSDAELGTVCVITAFCKTLNDGGTSMSVVYIVYIICPGIEIMGDCHENLWPWCKAENTMRWFVIVISEIF